MVQTYRDAHIPAELFPIIPVRWQREQPRWVRCFTLPRSHPLYGFRCATCTQPLSRYSALMAVGPLDADDEEHHDAGRWYSAGGVLVHDDMSCVDGLTPDTLVLYDDEQQPPVDP